MRRILPTSSAVSLTAGLCFGLALLASGWLVWRMSHVSSASPSREAAPDFATTSLSGQHISLAEARGRWVGLFFFCGCQSCRQAAAVLDRLAKRLTAGTIWGITELPPA